MPSKLSRLVTFPLLAGQNPPRARGLLWRLAHRLAPTAVPDFSDAMFDSNWHAERDPEENAKTAPPEDESIALPCVWTSEIYGPSHLPSLIAAVRRLGWEGEEHTTPLIREGIEEWLARARLHPFGGSWLSLGPITRPGTKGFLGGPRRAPLPPGIDYAFGSIRVLTPGLTNLTMQFFLEPRLRNAFERSLREAAPTRISPFGRGFTIESPQLRKRRMIAGQRKEIRRLCTSWFIDQAPGGFASYGGTEAWPTIELLALDKTIPFTATRVDGCSYQSTLGVSHDFDAWIWKPEGVLRFSSLASTEGPDGYYAVIGFNVAEALERLNLKGYGNGSVPEAVARRIQNDVEPLLTNLAGRSLLRCHERALARHRDNLRKPPRLAYRQASEELESLQELLRSGSDAQVAALDLARYSVDSGRFSRSVPHLEPARPDLWQGEESYAELLRHSIAADAARIRETHDFFREALMARASTTSTLVNVRLQRRIALLTWVLVILAIATLALAFAQLRSP
jgi:hypothetical protein